MFARGAHCTVSENSAAGLSRRRFLLGSGAAAIGAAAARPPNVIIIYTDDQGYGDLGCYGARDVQTPHLDALAASGVRFTNMYSAAPVCSPSRAALLTGRYPIRCGVPNIVESAANVVGLKAGEITLAEVLRQRGYRTGIAGKWHLGSAAESRPNAQGFDEFFGFHSGCVDYYSHIFYWGGGRDPFHDLWRNQTEVWEDGRYLTELITRDALRFVRQHRARPFFLYVAYNAPHYPMHAPQRYIDRFPGLDRERQVHAAMIAAVDDGVGEIIGLVKKLGLTNDTIVYFQSDNGATIETRAGRGGRNTPLRGFKFSLFEGGIRMPALLSWPGRIPPGRVVHEPAIAMDIFVTVAGAAGARPPADRKIDGLDILPTVVKSGPSPHSTLFWAQGEQTAARRGNFKLIQNGILGPGPQNRLQGDDTVFLADLAADPQETTNLRRKHPQVAAELSGEISKWLADVRRS
jgi:arylsulfatase A-like enzyme